MTRNRNRRLDPTIQRIAPGPGQSSSTPYSTPSSSWAPTVTTGVPRGGPLLRTANGPTARATVIGVRTNVSGRGLV